MAKFSGKAYVARTSHDQKHLNRLSVPEWGVVEISLSTNKSRSLSHRLPGATTARKPSGHGTDGFSFAPGIQFNPATWAEDQSRKDPVAIWYDLHNPFLNITKAKLEIFRRFDDDPIWEYNLKDEELLDGQHTLEFVTDFYPKVSTTTEWLGYIGSNKLFPENCLTVEHSLISCGLPWKVRGNRALLWPGLTSTCSSIISSWNGGSRTPFLWGSRVSLSRIYCIPVAAARRLPQTRRTFPSI